MAYYTGDGEIITQAQIETAVRERRAVIRWSHGEWVNLASLLIYSTADEASEESERNTVGECWRMADEIWSELVTEFRRARQAAAGLLKAS